MEHTTIYCFSLEKCVRNLCRIECQTNRGSVFHHFISAFVHIHFCSEIFSYVGFTDLRIV